MFLGIEIGGTKLQLGVGAGDGSEFVALQRYDVDASRGATGILEQIEKSATALMQRHEISRIGIGFGGPVDSSTGRVIKSHQIDGWDDLPLVQWCERTLGLSTALGNDCDVAALAEARFGAGHGKRIVVFVTVGTGVGGGLVIDGNLHGAGRPAVAEIGHLRPGLHFDRPDATVESLASGWGIVATAQSLLADVVTHSLEHLRRDDERIDRRLIRQRLEIARQADQEFFADLRHRCGNNIEQLTAKMIAQAAAEGNEVAREVVQHACEVLGWAIAQVITLVAPEVVVIGGGVSLIGEQMFFQPLRQQICRFVFPPLIDSYEIVPAKLGELVVVHGAMALAAS